ncbi:MAG: polymer-forming cytoskeletal protein [Bacteroidia bacterium]|nr:polymer-forming cytoskeletal protein [Bacteroidia bacterium]
MFGTKNENSTGKPSVQQNSSSGGGLNTISNGTVIVGTINAEGDMRVEGKIIGTVTCSSRLVVSASGYIEGTIDAKNAIVEGEIKGNVVAREVLQIDKTGKITGDIFTSKLVIQLGALFTGNCKMGDAAKDALSKTPVKPKELLESKSIK